MTDLCRGCTQIRATVEKLFKHVEPWQIFIADNGSSAVQVEATEMVCTLLSAEYRNAHSDYADSGINFGTYVVRPQICLSLFVYRSVLCPGGEAMV
jgi:hypothetical protein